MANENNEFKGFVKSEIKNVKDAAKQNYDEHKIIFGVLTDIREKVAAMEERLEAVSHSRAAKYGMWGAWGAAVFMAAAALIKSFT